MLIWNSDLMEKQNLEKLGFSSSRDDGTASRENPVGSGGGETQKSAEETRRGGFVAGLRRVELMKEKRK